MRIWNDNVDVTFGDDEARAIVRHQADYEMQVPYSGYQIPVQFGETYTTISVIVSHVHSTTRDKVEELLAEYGVVSIDYGNDVFVGVLMPAKSQRVYCAAGRAYRVEDTLVYQVL